MSTDSRFRIAELLRSRQGDILKQWTEIPGQALGGRMSREDLEIQVSQTYSLMQSMLSGEGEARLMAPAGAELRSNLGVLSVNWARQGFTPKETASWVFALRDVLLGVLAENSVLSTENMTDFAMLSGLIDDMGLYTFERYAQEREKLIADQSEQLLELSTPVIKLWEGVVAVPLVGTLDSARAQIVMETLLQTLLDTSSEYAIIDITGVAAVDTQVAQHILKTVLAARLMGAECVISGIRPQIAQTVVGLGIEFGDIVTKASLADALMYALGAGGGEMVQRSGGRES